MMADDDSGGPQKSSGPRLSNPLAQLRSKGWINLREFALIADVSYPTALRWAKLRMIHTIQVGGHKRVYRDEVRRFMEFGTREPEGKLDDDSNAT